VFEVDGGVKAVNFGRIAAAGCDVFVAGIGVFSTPDDEQTIALLRQNAMDGARR
jgi:pentose-5-phosphate-3-epimerase